MEKQRWEESEKRGAEERRSEQRKSEKKEDAGARKGSKVANHCVFAIFCGSGRSKSRLAKAAGVEPCGQMRDEKLHAVVAWSTFVSQNVQSTPFFSKSKCTKHSTFRALLEVEMLKECTMLWREAHVQVKMYKTLHVLCTFGSCDAGSVHDVVARSTFRSQNVKNTPRSEHVWNLRCSKSVCGCAAKHISKLKTEGYGALLDVQMSFRVAGARDCAPCQKWAKRKGFCSIRSYNHHYTTLYTPPHYTTTTTTTKAQTTTTTTLHYTALHYTNYITLHYTTLRYNYSNNYNYNCNCNYNSTTLITLHYTTLHFTPLHSTTLH